jgi:hypothetical protein
VLVIGRVVDAGCQHRDARLALAAGRGERGEALAQQIGIVLDRAHLVLVEQFREHLHHRFAVFQHVADTGRRAGIVFQHVELVLAGAHDVGADDVGVDAARRAEADHLGQEGDVVFDQLARNAAGADDFLLVVDVVEKGVEGDHPLLDALRELAPFAAGDDAGDDVEGDELFGGVFVAVDREGDAGLAEDVFRVAGLGNQMRSILAIVPLKVFSYGCRGLSSPVIISSNAKGVAPLFSSFEYNANEAMQEPCSVGGRRFVKSSLLHQNSRKTGHLRSGVSVSAVNCFDGSLKHEQ